MGVKTSGMSFNLFFNDKQIKSTAFHKMFKINVILRKKSSPKSKIIVLRHQSIVK